MTRPIDSVSLDSSHASPPTAPGQISHGPQVNRKEFLKVAAVATTGSLMAGQAAAGLAEAAAPSVLHRASAANLSMWHYKPELRGNIQHVLDAFHKDYPTITITQIPKPVDQYDQVLNTALAGEELPDLFQIHQTLAVPVQAQSGQLLDMTGKVPNIKNVLPIARAVNEIGGKLYTVTWGRYTVVMMYNRRLMAKLKLEPPRDWAELVSLCKKIKAAGVIPLAMSGDGTIDAFFFSEFATAALGPRGFADLLAGRKKFTAPELQQTMKFIVELEPYYQSGFLATKYADSKALFATEKAVMFEAGSADIPGFKDINSNLQIGVFPFPPPQRSGVPITLSGLDVTMAASPKTSNPDAVFAFQNWCISPKGATLCSSAINLSPVVKGVVPPGSPELRQIIAFSQRNDFPVWYDRPRIAPGFNIWATQGQGVFTGRLTSTQLLQMMQQQSDAAARGH